MRPGPSILEIGQIGPQCDLRRWQVRDGGLSGAAGSVIEIATRDEPPGSDQPAALQVRGIVDRDGRTRSRKALVRAGVGSAFVVVGRQQRRRDFLAPYGRQLAAIQAAAGRIHDRTAVVIFTVTRRKQPILLNEGCELVRRRELRRHLAVRLPAFGGVVEQRDIGKERPEPRHLLRRAADARLEIGAAQGAEEPDSVALDRSPESAVELFHKRRRGRTHSGRRRRVATRARRTVLHVVAVHVLGLIRERRGAFELVAAALGDDIDVQSDAHRR